MPSFPISSTQQLADFLIPVTPEMATEIIAQASAVEDGTAYAAVYYYGGSDESKRIRRNILIMVTLEFASNCFAYVRTDEYHPRKQGKADLVYKTDTFIRD